MDKQSLGRKGEELTLKHYQKNGYSLREKNFQYYGKGRGRKGEIDLILEKDNLIVIVEVKSRSSQKFGKAITQISPNQIKRIYQVYEYYISKKPIHKNKYVRIDIALIDNWALKIIENIQ